MLEGVTWTINDPTIAEIDLPVNPGDPTAIKALSVGSTTVLASYGDQTGKLSLTTYAGGALPIGTLNWQIPSLGSCCISRIVSAVLADESTPAYYVEDDGAAGGNGAIRAISSNGQQQWIWPKGSSNRFPLLAAADDQGGAIYFANNDTENQFQSWGYVGRVDENGNETWQYQMSNSYTDFAIHPDGTILLLEGDFQNLGVDKLTALDPNSGQIKWGIPVTGTSQSVSQNFTIIPDPNGTNQFTGQPETTYEAYCTPGTSTSTSSSGTPPYGAISIGSEGTIYLPFSGNNMTVFDGEPCDPSPDPSHPGFPHRINQATASWSATSTLQMMAIHSDGTYSVQFVDTQSGSGTNWAFAVGPEYSPLGRPIPDGEGGVLFPYGASLYDISTSGSQKFGLPAGTSPYYFFMNDLIVGGDGTAYLTASNNVGFDTLLAIDIPRSNKMELHLYFSWPVDRTHGG